LINNTTHLNTRLILVLKFLIPSTWDLILADFLRH
jgi:hypothetical protein